MSNSRRLKPRRARNGAGAGPAGHDQVHDDQVLDDCPVCVRLREDRPLSLEEAVDLITGGTGVGRWE